MANTSKTLELIMKAQRINKPEKFNTFQQFFQSSQAPQLFVDKATPKTIKGIRSYSNKSHESIGETKRKSMMIEYKKIKIYARLKPAENLYTVIDNSILVDGQSFSFDQVFQGTGQSEIYQVMQSTVTDLINGVNGCIIAYGQTGSGKTYTMLGDQKEPGLMNRIIEQLMGKSVEVSMLEIYRDWVIDLLGQGEKLKVKEDSGGFYAERLIKFQVHNLQQWEQLYQLAEQNRHMAETKMNVQSSRSHLIMTIYLNKSKLYLVDLAGSEKVHKSGAKGETLEEAKKINYSLSCLGHVIQCLANGQDHIPFRDSKLTKLLQDSLQAESRTSLIVTCSSEIFHKEETISSLKFAQRAKYIKAFSHKTQKKTYQELQQEIHHLQSQLQLLKQETTISTPVSNFQTRYDTHEYSSCAESIRLTHRSHDQLRVSERNSSNIPNIDSIIDQNMTDLNTKISTLTKVVESNKQHYVKDVLANFNSLKANIQLSRQNQSIQLKFVSQQEELNLLIAKALQLDTNKASYQFTLQGSIGTISKQIKDNFAQYQAGLDKLTHPNKQQNPSLRVYKENKLPVKRQISASQKYLKQ